MAKSGAIEGKNTFSALMVSVREGGRKAEKGGEKS